MPAHKPLIWGGSDGINLATIPDFLALGHLNIGTLENVEVNNASIPITGSHILAAEGSSGTTNQINTIDGGVAGSIIFLRCSDSITVKDNTGNLRLSGDFVMDHSSDILVLLLVVTGGNWAQIARANNG